MRPPTHPGEMLLLEFLRPRGISQRALAEQLGISESYVGEFVRGNKSMSAKVAILLAKHFGNSPEFWMNLQVARDLWDAKRAMAIAATFMRPRRARPSRPR